MTKWASGNVMKRGQQYFAKSAALESSGTSGPWIEVGEAGVVYVPVVVTAVAGTNPTLQLFIEGSPDAGTTVVTAGQIGAVGFVAGAAVQPFTLPAVAPTGIPASVAANATADVGLTGITGLLATDTLLTVGKAADQAGLFVLPASGAQGGVTGAGAATVRYCNCTIGAIVPTASENYFFTVMRAGAAPAAITGVGSYYGIFPTMQYMRYRSVIGGTGGPSFTYSVSFEADKAAF